MLPALPGLARTVQGGATEAWLPGLRWGWSAAHLCGFAPLWPGPAAVGSVPAKIVVARYAGTAMDDRFVKEEIRGTLSQQIRRAEAFVVDNLRRGVRLAGLERVEEPSTR